jgi:glutathione S-transferase
MSIVLHHHPFSRAATVVWMLEELGEPYELQFVDLMSGAQQGEAHLAINRMAKVPVLVHGEAVVSETAAIGLYLADRFPDAGLAPPADKAERAAYLRWSVYGATVVEPGCMAKSNGWEFRAGQAGWGSYDRMIETLVEGVQPGPWLLGERFSMADVTLGATLRWMLRFKMLEAHPELVAYVERLSARPAALAADAKNAEVAKAHGLG